MNKKEIEQELELAEMMVIDIEKIYKKYAKSAQTEAEKRQEKIKSIKYFDCNNQMELQELYGYGEITEEEYYTGIDFFKELELSKSRKSLIELHRQNIKELRDKWKGTVKELHEELDEISGVVKDKRTYVEKLEADERAQRYSSLY
ncbi:MAG TPA: hypothetical protein DC000_02745 [Clostridiales bacterium]|nr:hypothetical protein [Clostridiales bacterium]